VSDSGPAADAMAADAETSKKRGFGGWKAIVGVALSALLLWYTFRDADFREIALHVGAADPWQLLLGTTAVTFIFWVRAWRWRAILEAGHEGTSFQSRFGAVAIGFMGNNLLPARVGEFMRALSLSRTEPVPLVASFGSLVVERLLDAVFVLGLLFLAMTLPNFPAGRGGDGVDFAAIAQVMAIIVGLAIALLLLLVRWPERAVRLVDRMTTALLPQRLAKAIVEAFAAFLSGVGVLREGRLLLRALGWSAVLWVINGFGFWMALRAFDLDVSFVGALFFQSVIALGVSVPSAPGHIGPWHATARVVLVNFWGLPLGPALAFATAFHLAGFIPITFIGLYYAWKTGFSFRIIRHSEEVVEAVIEEEAVERRRHPRPPPRDER
jgi:glycosyltransferase 2 family protein